MAKLTPYIKSEDARAQAAFYTEALGGEVRSVVTHGQVMPNAPEATKDKVLHMELVAGGVTLFMTDEESVSHGNGIHLALELANEAEAHAAFAKLSAGGTVLHPLQPAFWGALHGEIKDKYGILWMITNTVNQSQS